MNEKYMRYAIELAKKGIGFVNPNPLVGAVIVKNDHIIGEGCHERYGTLHAERNAIASLTESAEGADIYVTLEPCCHHGKQPPCTEALVAAGIKNVYVGSYDPNPLVSGKGFSYLRKHGINVYENVLREECDALNDIFFHYITTQRPYVIMKSAMSIDGRTAAYTGDSKWITNNLSREDAHKTRKRCAAIMAGIGTALADDPMLNCRCDNPSQPIRIICDSNARIPMNSNLIKTARDIPVIIATTDSGAYRKAELEAAGAEVIVTSGSKVNLPELMTELGRRKIDSVLVEGGSELHASMLSAGLVNELHVYIAPKIIGGVNAKPVVGGTGAALVRDAYMFGMPQTETFGSDIKLIYKKEDANVHGNS